MSDLLQSYADIAFLALLLWREARGESKECKTGVAYSVLNRTISPSWGDTVMSVGFQHLQYSSLTYKGDPQLTTWPKDNDPSWRQCLEIAQDVLEGDVSNPIDGADSYHDISISAPSWAGQEKFVRQIGRIKFYKVGR